jgi:hypothetical protein
MPLPFEGRATRRTALVAASALALAGCRWGQEDEPETGSSEAPADPDTAVVDAAWLAISEVAALVDATRETHRELVGPLMPLSQVHQDHLALLGPGASVDGASSTVPMAGSARSALAFLRRDEQELQRQLASLALDATSGTLGRALASMSASIAQHLADLPTLGKGRS